MRAASLIAAFITGTIFASFLALAWTGPTSPPPSGNVSAPINVGTTDQVKDAGLALNALAVFGNAIISGTSRYLNFGTLAGESGYGIRNNNGIMEFKDSGGSWRSATSTIQNFFSSGSSNTVSQINFADGTTQTTAAGGAVNGTVGGGCSGNGSGWGNATNCATQFCSATGLGSCPSGYTARSVGLTNSVACSGGRDGPNCSCGFTMGSYPNYGTIYNPSYYAAPTLCIKN